MESIRLNHALVVSVGLHLLVVWIVASYVTLSPKTSATPLRPKPIRITLGKQQEPVTSPAKPGPAPSLAPEKAQPPTVQTQNNAQENESVAKSETPVATRIEERQSATDEAKARSITAAKIISSASEIAQGMAVDDSKDDTGDNKKEQTSVSAILDRALNSPKEAAGVMSLSDGTIRVVTEQGYTYCIKPLDDWRINGPADDMRVSVYCE